MDEMKAEGRSKQPAKRNAWLVYAVYLGLALFALAGMANTFLQ